MRLGAAIDTRLAASAPEFMEHTTDLGLDHVEFNREYLAGRPETPDAETPGALAEDYGVTLTLHAPFRTRNVGSLDETARWNPVRRVKRPPDDAATAETGAVVAHDGSVPERCPGRVRDRAAEHTVILPEECATHTERVGVPLCLENQPPGDTDRRYTTTPSDLARTLDAVDADPAVLGVTLDVEHAKIAGAEWRAVVDRFGDRSRVCHLHDNDGTADQHRPLQAYEPPLADIPADHASFETKRVRDTAVCLGATHQPTTPSPTDA